MENKVLTELLKWNWASYLANLSNKHESPVFSLPYCRGCHSDYCGHQRKKHSPSCAQKIQEFFLSFSTRSVSLHQKSERIARIFSGVLAKNTVAHKNIRNGINIVTVPFSDCFLNSLGWSLNSLMSYGIRGDVPWDNPFVIRTLNDLGVVHRFWLLQIKVV